MPWAADLEKRTNGRMKVMFYPSEALGKAKDHYDLVDRGIADLSDVPMVYMPGRFPLSSVLDLPLSIPSSKVGTRVGWELYDKYLRPEFPGVKIISYETNDPGHLFTTKKPVKTLADVKGMRLRVAGTWVTRTVKELGGSAVAIAGAWLGRIVRARNHSRTAGPSGGPFGLTEQRDRLGAQFGLRLGPPLLAVVGPVQAAVE